MIPDAGDAPLWDSLATTHDDAKFAVWSVPPQDYLATTDRTLGYLARHIDPEDPYGADRFLDVGCGLGRLSIPIANAYPATQIVGCDVSERMLDYARQTADESDANNVTFVRTDGRSVPGGPFDFAWSIVTFQHNPRDVCAALVRAVAAELEPGGRFLFQVVGDDDVQDEGHVSQNVIRSWVTKARLDLVSFTKGDDYSADWLWTEARKP